MESIRPISPDLTGSESLVGKGPAREKNAAPKEQGPAGARTNSPENYAKHASKSEPHRVGDERGDKKKS